MSNNVVRKPRKWSDDKGGAYDSDMSTTKYIAADGDLQTYYTSGTKACYIEADFGENLQLAVDEIRFFPQFNKGDSRFDTAIF
jgi:hypothetical protein